MKTIEITQRLSDAFRDATGDKNDLHQKYALGFHLEFLIEDAAQQTGEEDNVGNRCVSISTDFKKPLPIDSEVTIEVKKINDFGHYTAMMRHHADLVATSALIYSLDGSLCAGIGLYKRMSEEIKFYLEDLANGRKPLSYRLCKDQALATTLGFERDEHAMRNQLLALSSNALLQTQGDKLKGKIPAYTQHTIVIHPYAHKIGEEEVVLRTAHAHQERNSWTGFVYGELADQRLKTPLFSAQLSIMAISPKALDRLLKE